MKKIVLILLTLLTSSLNLFAEEMSMTDTNGTSYKVVGSNSEMKIEGMEGKVVFLEFFGLQCPACKEAMPNLINIQNKYPNKLQVMAIEVQKNDIDPINAYKKEHGINYPTFSNFDVGRVARFIIEKSGWQGAIPFTIIIDAQGKVQFTQAGIIPPKILEESVEKFSK
jgi:thiol-disulfide isomerase/thioredoxin